MKTFFKMLNPKNYNSELNSYGLDTTFKSQLYQMGFFLIGLVLLGNFLGLTWQYLSIITLFMVGITPFIILSTYKLMYERSRFTDVADYIEQVLYSFKRRPKILNSLQDTLKVFNNKNQRMRIDIEKAINTIESSSRDLGGESIYKVALDEISKDFDCRQLEMTHKFLCSVEHDGGAYDKSADIILEVRNQWVRVVEDDQLYRKSIKRNAVIAVVASLVLMSITTFMVPKDLMDLRKNIVSHISTTFFFITDMLVWLYINIRLNGSLLMPNAAKKEVINLYNSVAKPRKKNNVKTFLNIVVFGGLVGMLYYITKNISILVVGIGFMIIVQKNPKRVYRLRVKRLRREVEKAFPDWMISMSLLLQTDNVHVAISKSIADAPEVLKIELEKLVDGIDSNPLSVEPYLNFFGFVHSEDVKSSMKLLYSMSQFGSTQMTNQIHSLVDKNTSLQIKSDKMRAEDFTAGVGFMVYVPMLLGMLKMGVDGALLFIGMMRKTGL